MAPCRRCGKTWPADYAMCPDDGTGLGSPSQLTTPAVGGVGALAIAQSPYDEDLAPGSLAGEYRIEKKIGEGGMGAVYGAKHPLIGKRAAIKVIRRELSSNPDAVDRFIREAQAVNTIGHPNIVDVFAFGVLPDGRSYFVMEWLVGESLRQRIERPLTYAEVIEIVDTIAKALNAAHDAGVVHRDLKPDNVFLSAVKGEKPVVMLLDFGLAKLTSVDGKIDQTRTGVVMGTPLYISPEQAKGSKVDAATDIYALGVIAYEMFSGRVPFVADSAVEIMTLHITQQPWAPSQVATSLPREVDTLVLAMMAKHPSQRPTLPEVRRQLAALSGLASSIAPVGGGVLPRTWPAATPVPNSPMASTILSGATSPASFVSAAPPPRRTGLVIGITVGVCGVLAAVLVTMLGGSRGEPDNVAALEPAKIDPTTAAADPAKLDPAKPDPAKPDPAKPDPAKPDPATLDSAKPDPAKLEAATVDPTKPNPDPAKPDPANPDPAKPDPAKPDPKSDQKRAKLGTVNVTIAGAARAMVFVDGRLTGKSVAKLTLSLTPGDHKIRADAPKHTSAEATVHVGAGRQSAVRLTLKKTVVVNGVEDPFAP